MPTLLRRKLNCFYCGLKSDQLKSAGLQHWHCKHCDAENWLDENGDITDPPTEASSSNRNARFVQPQTVDPLIIVDPVSANTDDLFCATCLKNQHIQNESLAAFYPAPTHDQFVDFEKSEQQFRTNLDERYPIICEGCEPRVRAKLKRVNYGAKADHMMRVTERLRTRKAGRAGWKGTFVAWGGFMWFLSWMVQLGWHVLGLIDATTLDGRKDILRLPIDSLKLSDVVPASLERTGEHTLYIGLWVGLLSIWWHPRMGEKLIKPFGKLHGLSDYYKLQVVFLAARIAVWYWVTQTNVSDAETIYGIHLLTLVFSLFTITTLYCTVSTDYTPKVSFKESPEPLVKYRSGSGNNANIPPPTQLSFNRGNAPITRPRHFSINDLAPRAATQASTSKTRLPTPPPEADYLDPTAMDWSRTPMPLRKSTPNLPPPFKPQPSPFHNDLSNNTDPPARRPYQPPGTKVSYRAAMAARNTASPPISSDTRNSRSITPPKSRTTGHALDLHPLIYALENQVSPPANHDDDDDDDHESVVSNLSPRKNPFASQEFFPQQAVEETGLEGIMAQAFRIGEVPTEVARTREEERVSQEAVRRDEVVARSIARSIARRALLATIFIGCIGALSAVMSLGLGDGLAGWLGGMVMEKGKQFLDM